MKPTERFREHHEKLVKKFNRLSTKSRNGSEKAFRELFRYLETRVLSHVRAEEELLYERVDEVTGAKCSTATMRMDHRELERRAENFNNPQFPREFGERVNSFSTLFLHHCRKEEEVLLPFLSEQLEQGDFEELLERLHEREKSLAG